MSTLQRNLAIGLAVFALFAVGGGIAAVSLFLGDSEPMGTEALIAELRSPMAAPTGWRDTADAVPLFVETEPTPSWRNEYGDLLFEGPDFGERPSQWSTAEFEDWEVLLGRSTSNGVDLTTEIWTVPNFPMAILDMEAKISGAALEAPLTVTTIHPNAEGRLLSTAFDEIALQNKAGEAEILAARLDTQPLPLSIQSVAHGTGHAQSTGNRLEIDWELWPGLEGGQQCAERQADDEDPTVEVSLRLLIHFGGAPTVGPHPIPASATMLGVPIFVDAPATHGAPLLDGSARDAEDFARRLRALAFGHSDREDPRFGNGGLLASGLGAIFAIPPQWWDEPAIRELRESLRDREIELVPLGEVDYGEESVTSLVSEDPCRALSIAHRHQTSGLPVRLHRGQRDRPYRHNLASPLPISIEFGQAPVDRQELLKRIFSPGRSNGIFADGQFRLQAFPLVATRSPIEEISEHALLSPDRRGHWTLHDSLSRRLTHRDLDPDSSLYHSISLRDLRNYRRDQAAVIPFWSPDGEIRTNVDDAVPLYFFGDGSELAEPIARGPGMIRSHLFEPRQPARIDTPMRAVRIEFSDQ